MFAVPSLRWRPTAVATALALLATAMAVGTLQRISGPAARTRWRAEISQAPPGKVPKLLERLTERPDVALPLLVELLDDDRPDVAAAAHDALAGLLQRWRSMPLEASSPRVARLARQLAEAAPAFRSRGRYAAVQLVEVIVAWPFDEDAIDVAAVLADCETVLRAGDGRPDDLLTSVAAGSERRFASPPPPGLPVVNDGPEPSADSPLSLARPLPGGGLPVKPEGVPGLPDSIADAYPQPIPGARRADRYRLPPPEIYAPLAIPLDAETSGPSAGKADPTAPSNEPATIADSEQNPLQDLDDVALMRRLQDGSRSERAAAELRRRGFDALRLEIARRLTHPEPQIRKELANALPQLPGVDAQPWLEELAADRDPEVRRVAISILGSDANPQVDAWLRERRREERDPRVAEMIDEILEKRR